MSLLGLLRRSRWSPRTATPHPSPPRTFRSHPRPDRPLVLVLQHEDEPFGAVDAALDILGCDGIWTHSTAEACERLSAGPTPEVVVVDVSSSKPDVDFLVKHMSTGPEGTRVPLLLWGSHPEVMRTVEVPHVCWVRKPCRTPVLVGALESLGLGETR
ncbi:MAG: hypothetical protein AB2A00_39430 [Myxococcota bacterium]